MNRPERCTDVMQVMIRHGITTPGVLIVNGRQREDEYRAIELPLNWTIEVLPHNIGICGALNKMFSNLPTEPWYGIVCDDEYVFTDGFDRRLVNESADWGIAHGNDTKDTRPHKQVKIHTYAVFGGELLRAMGFWCLDGCWHAYADWAWQTIADEFGLARMCHDVITEHRCYDYGAAPIDETYHVAHTKLQQDRQRYERWLAQEWPALKIRLQLALR